MTVLVVAALDEEVAHVRGVEVLVTGVGKAVAAARLARRLSEGRRPSLVVNVGTAGALAPVVDPVVEVGYVTQHDFPYAAIEGLVGTSLPRGFRLSPHAAPAPVGDLPPGAVAVASGDVFVDDTARAQRIAATGVQLVDMESYAYAATCAAFALPMRCVKAVSDAADADAGLSWLDSIDRCARDLAAWVERHLPSG